MHFTIHKPVKSLDFPVFPDVSHIVTHFLVSDHVFDIYSGSPHLLYKRFPTLLLTARGVPPSSRSPSLHKSHFEAPRPDPLKAPPRPQERPSNKIDVPDALKHIEIPKLTLQPLVENALNHGYDGINVLCILSVTGKIRNEQLILEICDNGTGFSDEILQNLRQQINDINSGKGSIEISQGCNRL